VDALREGAIVVAVLLLYDIHHPIAGAWPGMVMGYRFQALGTQSEPFRALNPALGVKHMQRLLLPAVPC
jgi:hypothetical protein